MNITSDLFETFLKCPTKCYLHSIGESGAGNAYAEWVRKQNDGYRIEATQRLLKSASESECVAAPSNSENLKSAKWRLALDIDVKAGRNADNHVCKSDRKRNPNGSCPLPSECDSTEKRQHCESRLHALERVSPKGRARNAQFIPIRFVFRNKLTKDDRLLLAFDARVLYAMLGHKVSQGKIIHGDNQVTLKVKLPPYSKEVQKRVATMAEMLTQDSPPDLILNRHCTECEFHNRCRQQAIEKDDLSLLARMSEKERKEFNTKGIFTVTQLSYTFRPRRRPKKLRDKREKYHHSLKAFAIREKKIYIVGKPESKIEGTPVFFDVEALPDLDFYYLIGARVRLQESCVCYSFWADDIDDMPKMWMNFLNLLASLDRPQLIHYGNFDATFLKRMLPRVRPPTVLSDQVTHAVKEPVNLLSTIYSQVYFPTISNSLKEIAALLGFKWSETDASGPQSIIWRHDWNQSKDSSLKTKLIRYNAEDCEALEIVAKAVSQLASRCSQSEGENQQELDVIHTENLKDTHVYKWSDFSSPLSDLEFINKAAYWNYQRDRIYVRSSKQLKRLRKRTKSIPENLWRAEKVIEVKNSTKCPRCQQAGYKYTPARSKTVQEIIFGRFSLRKRVLRYDYQAYWCSVCQSPFGIDEKILRARKHFLHGRSICAYIFYQVIDLRIPMQIAAKSLGRLFGVTLNNGTRSRLKSQMAKYYQQTYEEILERIVTGELVHVDETPANIKGKQAYVWVFTNMHQVVYIYSDSREGELLKTTLAEFKGVIVSDFYAAYDSLEVPQQKCLIHLIRDLNGALLKTLTMRN